MGGMVHPGFLNSAPKRRVMTARKKSQVAACLAAEFVTLLQAAVAVKGEAAATLWHKA
jgi:hypothetical protein